MSSLRLGFIGLDTSHVEGFAALLNDPAHPQHVPGGRIVAAFPGGSPDFPLSANRVEGYTRQLRDRYGIALAQSPLELAASVDAVLLTSVDGRVHLDQFSAIAKLGKPVFMDKPFALTSSDARAIAALARAYGTPLFSSSSLRFADALTAALGGARPIGADFFGPMKLQPTQTGFFWYGVHMAEMLYATLGTGCRSVQTVATPHHELIIGTWEGGRIGTVRGNRAGNDTFGGVIHRAAASQWIDCSTGRRPDVGLTQAIMNFFRGGPPPIPLDETIELVRFLEAANLSHDHGGELVLL